MDDTVAETRSVPLGDGRVLVVRPVRPTDADGLAALFAGLSEDDLYLRFFSGGCPPRGFIDEMASPGPGGVGLVAEVDDRVVGEASGALLPNGDAELGITVAREWRGWLGAFLLDVLREAAAARGIPNLEAEVLVANRPMLGLLHKRPYALMERPDWTTVRVVIGAAGVAPTWPAGEPGSPRVLVEAPAGFWRHENAARHAGMRVLDCPGPGKDRARCPALRGDVCPLAAGADVIVGLLPDIAPAHERVHPGVPVCAVPADASDDEALRLLEAVLSRRP